MVVRYVAACLLAYPFCNDTSTGRNGGELLPLRTPSSFYGDSNNHFKNKWIHVKDGSCFVDDMLMATKRALMDTTTGQKSTASQRAIQSYLEIRTCFERDAYSSQQRSTKHEMQEEMVTSVLDELRRALLIVPAAHHPKDVFQVRVCAATDTFVGDSILRDTLLCDVLPREVLEGLQALLVQINTFATP